MKRILLAFGLIIAFAACKTATPTTDWTKECAARFPPRTDTFRITTEKIKFDTLFAAPTRVPYSFKTTCPPSDTVRIVDRIELVDCPPVQTVIKTRILHDSIIVYTANTALESLLKSQLDTANARLEASNRVNRSLKTDISAQKRQTNRLTWLSLFLVLVVAFLTWFSFKFKKKRDEKNPLTVVR